MSDAFINTLGKLIAGESITYYAASPESRDKVLALLSMQAYSVDVQKQGKRRYKIVITKK